MTLLPEFEFGEAKSAANAEKHGIDFHEAQAFVVGRQPDAASRSLPR